jgi:hypothetical protein
MRARVLLALILAASALPAAAGPAIPAIDGPDLPALGTPTVVTVFDEARFECTGSPQTALIQVPDGPHDRIVLELTVTPDGDPWDRLAAVAIGGAEVLRATTPRTEMTLRKDITTYSELLPPGGQAEVSLLLSTYVGALLGTVHLEFYADEPTAGRALGRAERQRLDDHHRRGAARGRPGGRRAGAHYHRSQWCRVLVHQRLAAAHLPGLRRRCPDRRSALDALHLCIRRLRRG